MDTWWRRLTGQRSRRPSTGRSRSAPASPEQGGAGSERAVAFSPDRRAASPHSILRSPAAEHPAAEKHFEAGTLPSANPGGFQRLRCQPLAQRNDAPCTTKCSCRDRSLCDRAGCRTETRMRACCGGGCRTAWASIRPRLPGQTCASTSARCPPAASEPRERPNLCALELRRAAAHAASRHAWGS